MQRFSALVKSFLHLPLTGQVLPSPAPEQGLSVSQVLWAFQRGQLPDLRGVSQSLSLKGTPTYVVYCTIFCSVDPWKQALGIPGSHESPQRSHIICIFTKKSNQNGALSMLLIFISKCFSLTPYKYYPQWQQQPVMLLHNEVFLGAMINATVCDTQSFNIRMNGEEKRGLFLLPRVIEADVYKIIQKLCLIPKNFY